MQNRTAAPSKYLPIKRTDFIILANKKLRLQFNCLTGALTGITARGKPDWHILDKPELGLSFKLMVPLSEEKRNNPVFGEKQKLASLGIDGEKQATLVWKDPVSEFGGVIPLTVTIQVKLTETAAIFTTIIENKSQYIVENIYAPCFGNIAALQGAAWLKTFMPGWYSDPIQSSLWPQFDNNRGYYGTDVPTYMHQGIPRNCFVLIHSGDRGLYAGTCSNKMDLMGWQFELHPGYSNAINNQVPGERNITAKPVQTRFMVAHAPYIMPGETCTLAPITLEPFEGDWHAGADIYKRWRSAWMKPARPPAWARKVHSWLQYHINSPEDELRMKFSELIKLGESCARHGVKAIQLVGWNHGGQDRNNPSHDPDSRLGGFQELKNAIEKIQALGVKVILFTKFTWADRSTERFRNNLVKYAIKDPYGDYCYYSGYQYQTASQLLDLNTRRLVPLCFLAEGYIKECEKEFAKVVDLGAAGMLFDEALHHGTTWACYDTAHGHRYGANVYEKDREFVDRMDAIAKRKGATDFLHAAECCYDWEYQAYHLSYLRSWSVEHIPIQRYLLPNAQIMTAITGFDDRNMINQCLLYRYIISYEPYNFKGSLDDFPATVAYGKKMDALRSELHEFFWNGEFCDTLGAKVFRNDGKKHHPYAVYKKADGLIGVVVANYDEKKSIKVTIKLENRNKVAKWRTVDSPQWHQYKNAVIIPPQSAIIAI